MSETSGLVSVIKMAILRNVTSRKDLVNVRTVLLLLMVKRLKVIKCFLQTALPLTGMISLATVMVGWTKNRLKEKTHRIHIRQELILVLQLVIYRSLIKQIVFDLLIDSGSSKHFIDPELIRGVRKRMSQHTEISSPMEIKAAGDKTSYGTTQGVLFISGDGI